ncbi:hypothetical protein SHJG_7306 [Streptomyces hygroscopicus subsp. jinggangensis 5008]|nr:hypothetical protein SHJG_7306 [Streptomyces hygroscopicus subsp. jinggangensis 5008]AGF66728.1 hypothetical protein SHJGH_7066 [Streptomyces hygroscopicus subsp. jinggangensis TL01]
MRADPVRCQCICPDNRTTRLPVNRAQGYARARAETRCGPDRVARPPCGP